MNGLFAHVGVDGVLAADGHKAGAQSPVQNLAFVQPPAGGVQDARHGGVACAGGIDHPVEAAAAPVDAAARPLVIDAVRAETHKDPAYACGKHAGAGLFQILLGGNGHVRQNLHLQPVGFDGVEPAQNGHQLAGPGGAHRVYTQGRGAVGCQIIQRAGGKVTVAHHQFGPVQKLHLAGHKALVHLGENAHVAHGHQHIAGGVHDGDVGGGGMPRPGEHAVGAHAQCLAAGAQHLTVGIVAHCSYNRQASPRRVRLSRILRITPPMDRCSRPGLESRMIRGAKLWP